MFGGEPVEYLPGDDSSPPRNGGRHKDDVKSCTFSLGPTTKSKGATSPSRLGRWSRHYNDTGKITLVFLFGGSRTFGPDTLTPHVDKGREPHQRDHLIN